MKTGRIALVALLCACSGGSDPVTGRVGADSLERAVGPGGAILRGDGAGPLEGLLIEVPAGALRRLVQVSVEPGTQIEEPGTRPVSAPVRITMDPDPGIMLRPVSITMRVDVPEFRAADDLVVCGRHGPALSAALEPGAAPRRVVVADQGTLDRATRRFHFTARMLGDMQVRLADRDRLVEDAAQLVVDGYARLAELSSTSVVDADVMFSEAQAADPWFSLANLLRAVSRILVVLDDRRDHSPGLDSIGEVLEAYGIDVANESVLSRLQSGRWPRELRVPAGAPPATAVQRFLRERVRPAFAAAMRDLDGVASDTGALVELPAAFALDPGGRELDPTDVLAVRALVAGGMFAIDWLEDLELEVDLHAVTTPGAEPASLEEFFAPRPALGRLRSMPEPRTVASLREALHWGRVALEALDGEADPQDDDLLVFTSGATGDRRSEWRSALAAIAESLGGSGSRAVALGGVVGEIVVDLGAPLASGAFEPGFARPEFLGSLPLSGTIDRPDLGGLLPGATQDDWTDWLDLYDVHEIAEAEVVVDGAVGEWPAATEALAPRDPRGDAGVGDLRGVDLERLFLATSGDDLAFRIAIVGDSIGFRGGQATAYGLEIRERTPRGFGRCIDVAVHVEAAGLRVVVQRDGVAREVRASAAASGPELELALNRFDLLDPDEPVTDRVIRAWSEALDPVRAVGERDRTRGVAVRF